MQIAAAVISDDRLDGEGKDVAKFPFVQLWPSIVTSRQRSHPTMPAIFMISVVSFSGFPGVHSYHPHARTQRPETDSQVQLIVLLGAVRQGH